MNPSWDVPLCDEYETWCRDNDVPCISADEHVLGVDSTLTEEQQAWIADFIRRWDEAAEDCAGDPQMPGLSDPGVTK
jgi:hypothetical protein